MTADRRKYDPYAPAPLAAASSADGDKPTDTAPAVGSDDAQDIAAQIPDDLDEISKDDLIALAELADVATWGTKQQIADRVRAAAG